MSEKMSEETSNNSSSSSPSVASLPPEQELMQSAVSFLQHPSVKEAPLQRKTDFLRRKGLSETQIQEALRLADAPSSNQPAMTAPVNTLPVSNGSPVYYSPASAALAPVVPARRMSWATTASLGIVFSVLGGALALFLRERILKWLRRQLFPSDDTESNASSRRPRRSSNENSPNDDEGAESAEGRRDRLLRSLPTLKTIPSSAAASSALVASSAAARAPDPAFQQIEMTALREAVEKNARELHRLSLASSASVTPQRAAEADPNADVILSLRKDMDQVLQSLSKLATADTARALDFRAPQRPSDTLPINSSALGSPNLPSKDGTRTVAPTNFTESSSDVAANGATTRAPWERKSYKQKKKNIKQPNPLFLIEHEMATAKLLMNQFRATLREPVEGFTVELENENIFSWIIWLEGPSDTFYEDGVFKLRMTFPNDYPMSPPELTFLSKFLHPNVFESGLVCISILHAPGEDVLSGELPEERWLPTQTVTTVILSVLSMLSDPNFSSPANVDASVMWRNDPAKFEEKVRELVKMANVAKPDHVVIPHPDTNPEERKKHVERIQLMNQFHADAFDEEDMEHSDRSIAMDLSPFSSPRSATTPRSVSPMEFEDMLSSNEFNNQSIPPAAEVVTASVEANEPQLVKVLHTNVDVSSNPEIVVDEVDVAADSGPVHMQSVEKRKQQPQQQPQQYQQQQQEQKSLRKKQKKKGKKKSTTPTTANKSATSARKKTKRKPKGTSVELTEAVESPEKTSNEEQSEGETAVVIESLESKKSKPTKVLEVLVAKKRKSKAPTATRSPRISPFATSANNASKPLALMTDLPIYNADGDNFNQDPPCEARPLSVLSRLQQVQNLRTLSEDALNLREWDISEQCARFDSASGTWKGAALSNRSSSNSSGSGSSNSFSNHAPSLTAQVPVPAAPSGPLMLAEFNVLRSTEAAGDARSPALLRELQQCAADVLVLCEVTPSFQALLLAERWVRKQYYVTDSVGDTLSPFGTLILSKIVPARVTLHDIPSRVGRKVILLRYEFSSGADDLVLAAVQLESTPLDRKLREAQLEVVFELLREERNALIIGDFGFGENTRENTMIRAHFLDVWKTLRPSDAGFTHDVTRNGLAREREPQSTSGRYDRALLYAQDWAPLDAALFGTRSLLDAAKLRGGRRVSISRKQRRALCHNGVPLWPSSRFGLRVALGRRLDRPADDNNAAVAGRIHLYLENEEQPQVRKQCIIS